MRSRAGYWKLLLFVALPLVSVLAAVPITPAGAEAPHRHDSVRLGAPDGSAPSAALAVADFDSMVVDPVGGHVFIASPASNAVAVVDFAGQRVALLTDLPGASSLVLAGSVVYVSEPTVGIIARISTTSLSMLSPLATGLQTVYSVVFAAGHIWAVVERPASPFIDFVAIDPVSGARQRHQTDQIPGVLWTSPYASDTLLFAEGGVPVMLSRYDLSTGAPVLAVRQFENDLAGVQDLVAMPSGTFVPASYNSGVFWEYGVGDLVQTGLTYQVASTPTAVAFANVHGGLLALATVGHVLVHAAGTTDQLADIAVGPYVENRGVRFSPDGSRLFVVTHSTQDGGSIELHSEMVRPGLSGRITQGGASLRGAHVELTDLNGNVEMSAVADSGGYYTFDGAGMPTTPFRLHVKATPTTPDAWLGAGGAVAASGQASSITYASGQRLQLEVDLPVASIRGRLVNGHGAALPGLAVTASSDVVQSTSLVAMTDANGVFVISALWPASMTFSVVDPLWVSSAHAAGYHREWFGRPGREQSGAGPAVTIASVVDLGSQTMGTHDCDQATFVPSAVLDHRDLSGCDLDAATLAGAVLSSSDLTRSRLRSADLRGADFAGADLTNADLSFARTAASSFAGAHWSATTCPDTTSSTAHGQTCVGHLGFAGGGDGSPVGSLDKLEEVDGGVDLSGWAIDPNTPGPVTVRATVDGAGVVDHTASDPHAELPAPFVAYGANHGFAFHLDMPYGGVHEVCGVAVNVLDGHDTRLGCIGVDRGASNTWFNAVNPKRVLDKRNGLGAPINKVASGHPLELHVTGQGGIAAAHVSTVVLNLTVTNPTAAAYVTVWPSGVPQPPSSNLNFGPGQTVANLVTVEVGIGGNVSIALSGGAADLVADVAGWYDDGTEVSGSTYVGVSPARVLDTRTGNGAPIGALHAGSPSTVQVAGRWGVPATGVDAVIVNITATNSSSGSFLTAWPAGAAMPNVSNVNFGAGQTVPNLAIVKLSADGRLEIANAQGSTDVVIDVEGWFDEGGTPSHSAFVSFAPVRLYDSRDPAYGPPAQLGGDRYLTFDTSALSNGRAVRIDSLVLNVTVTNATQPSFLTAFPDADSVPNASNLNFAAGQTVPNLVTVRVGANGMVGFVNAVGTTDIVIDIAGWYETPMAGADEAVVSPAEAPVRWSGRSGWSRSGRGGAGVRWPEIQSVQRRQE